MIEYYDRKGKPISMTEASRLGKNRDYKVVKQTVLPNGYWVSTVWIPINLSWSNDGPPLIFETMVFPHDGKEVTDWGELDCERYSTEEDAVAGHAEMLLKWAER